MRLAFNCPALAGHLNPMTALARRLNQRGHETVFITMPENVPVFQACGVDAMGYQTSVFPPGQYLSRVQELSRLSGLEAVQFTFNLLADGTRAILEGGEAGLEASGAQAMILDSITTGFNLVCLHRNFPFIQVSNALYLDLTGSTPLPMYDWPHDPTPEGRARNLKGLAAFAQLAAPVGKVARAYAHEANLAIDWNSPYAASSPLAQLTQTPLEFDFPSDAWPPNLHHCGPFHDGNDRSSVDFPWDRLTGEPIIYASLGTLQNGLEHVFQTIADAAAAPGTQLVLSIGNNLDPQRIGNLPENTIVVRKAPQIELLKRSALCITHAGLNTALESLAQGVPMVAIPITNDQPGVAARIAYTKTGVFIPFKDLSTDRLRDAVSLGLSDPQYRENARRLQAIISRSKGLDRAADVIEQTLSPLV